MARAQFYDVGIDSSGNAVTSTQVSVYARGTTTLSTIYSNETGSTPKSNPFNASTGAIDFWASPGEYDIAISDTNAPPAFASRTIGWSSIPGVDGVIAQTIADNSVVTAKIASESVTYEQIAKSPLSLHAVGAVQVTSPKNIRSLLTVDNTITTANISTRLLWDTVAYDPGSCFDASTGIYTAPLDAVYKVNFKLLYASWAGSGRLIAKAGNYYTSGSISSDYTNALPYGDVLVSLNTGATIGLHAGKNSAAGISITLVNDTSSYFNIIPLYKI